MVSVVELKNMGGGSIFFVHVCPLFGFLFSGFFGDFFFCCLLLFVVTVCFTCYQSVDVAS